MANKFDGDVRPLSNDQRYMGVVFEGLLEGGEHADNALVQARAAKDWGLAPQPGRPARISRDRWNLLEHLNLSKHYMERKPPKRAPSPFSVEYAISRGWIMPVQS
jgi:hypothetical protein